ncbi:uncharacterized protein C2orf80-like isoform X2 [Heptranchias perlo]|uniref:uncharacterized protein C2orf80-like isoform X2 n=1 Tax=Heptranchias perlo TaxID=212740 RepID=UPI003559F76A
MALKVEKRRIKKEIEKLLRNYVGTRLRENSFDPKGKMESTYLNDLAHYDLAINVALLWLNEDEDQEVLENEKVIPLEDILELYRYRPTVTQFCKTIKGHVQPSSLSLHPFAMLTAACAAEHARKQSIKLKVGKITSKQNFMGPSMTSRSADQPPDNCSGTQQNADTSSHPGEEKAEEETGI